jgi:outer membrane protein OmpA-like peptidoglycan-associated protein
MKALQIMFILFATLIPVIAAQTVTLEWDIPKGERLELVRTAKVNTYVNRKPSRSYDERNIIDLSCYDSSLQSSSVQGDFAVFTKESGESVFRLEKRDYSDFVISRSGLYTVPERYIMPNMRNVPVFPTKPVSEGETWSAPATILFDNFTPPVSVQFPVQYRLVKIERQGDLLIAVIRYEFSFEKNIPTKNRQDMGSFGGKYSGLISWDVDGKKPVKGSDVYKAGFLYPDKTFVEFHMNIESNYRTYGMIKPDEKEKAKQELKKDLEDNKGITVDSDDRGLILRMGEVLFDFDSAALRPDTKKTLDVITDILRKKYPDREILVEGHTDGTGDRNYNQKLSGKRAETVADFLKKGVGHDKMSYKGYGPDRPIGDNKTKEGQAKNRRVEIIIKLK